MHLCVICHINLRSSCLRETHENVSNVRLLVPNHFLEILYIIFEVSLNFHTVLNQMIFDTY